MVLGDPLVEQFQHPFGGADDVVVGTDVLVDLRTVDIDLDDLRLAGKGGRVRATRSEKRQPTAMSRSHWSQAVLEAWVPCIPTMPVVRGCAPGKPPPP